MLSIVVTILVTFASQTWLQAIHVTKHRNNIELLRGVSVTSQTITIASQPPWIIYSLEYGLIGGMSNSVLSMVSAIVILIPLYRQRIPLKSDTTWLIVATLASIAASVLLPMSYVAVIAALTGPIFLLPQTVKTVRCIGTPSVHGIANTAIAMIICANTVWIIYGVIYQSWAYILSSGAVLACGLTMAAAKLVHRRVTRSESA